VCLDEEGRSQFNPLLFRRCNPVFAVFDVVWSGRRDLRTLPLVKRKALLRELVPTPSTVVLHVDFILEKGKQLFELACERDLEGVVGKWAEGTYQSDGRSTSWVKVKNPAYSQLAGRADLFERKPGTLRPRRPELALR
jgi:bifunctional non-homologous end joining protein LigD